MKNHILNIKYITFLILFATMSCNKSFGQSKSIPTINQQETHILKSKINETTYHLDVSLPQNYSTNDTTHYPVLYLLDGGLSFPIAHAVRTSMDMFGSLEDVIIVGIEYEWEKSLAPWMTNRWRDYTTTQDSISDENPAFKKTFGLPSGSLISGGASIFLDVIKNEIIPLIDKKYKTNTDRGISGHSLGGLFVSYCLLSNSSLFSKYGINSPSLWWNGKEIFNIEKSYSESNAELPAKVFMSVGSLEGKSMTPVMTDFANALRSRNYNGLNLTIHIFEDETHLSVVPAMISRTIKVLYSSEK